MTESDDRFVYDYDTQLLKFHGRTLPAKRLWTTEEDEATQARMREIGVSPHVSRCVRMTFENGWHISIIWGSLTYSSNHDHPFGYDHMMKERVEPEFIEEPTTVEIAVLCPDDKIIDTTMDWPELPSLTDPDGPPMMEARTMPHRRFMATWADGDTVCGYVTPEHLSTVVDYVMTIPSDAGLDDVLIPSESSAPTLKTYIDALLGEKDHRS